MYEPCIRRKDWFVSCGFASACIVRRIAVTVIEPEHGFVATNDQRKLPAAWSVQEDDIQQVRGLGEGSGFEKGLVEL